MRQKLFLLAGACALGLAAPAAAAPGQCFNAAAQPIGPVYDTEAPDTGFISWVQSRGGECRALRADEVTLDRGQPRGYPEEYRVDRGPPAQVAPGAPPVPAPPSGSVTWEGDPALAQRLIVAYYQPQVRDVSVVDTGRVVSLSSGGYWRIYEMTSADGSRRQVAVRMQPDRRYVLIENDGRSWSEVIYLDR